VGGGLTDRLRELSLPVTAIVVGGQSPDRRFLNLRAFGYWNLREAFRLGGISVPPNAALQRDLTGLRYEVRSDGKIKIESKDDAAKRGIESPDHADALCLAFWPAGASPAALYQYYRSREAAGGTDSGFFLMIRTLGKTATGRQPGRKRERRRAYPM
jgi:hypothetical protein